MSLRTLLLFVLPALATAAHAAPIAKGQCAVGIKDPHFRYNGDERGGQLLSGNGGFGLEFRVRYELSTFWGDPLEIYAPYYQLGDQLVLKTDDGVRVTFRRRAVSRCVYSSLPDEAAGSGGVIDVPLRIYDKIELTSYRARLTLGTLGSARGVIDVNNVGLLGNNGQWGTDFPASSSFSSLFIDTSPEDARNIWKEFAKARRSGLSLQPDLDLTEYTVDVVSFGWALRKQIPNAFHPFKFYGRDWQAKSLIDGLKKDLRANPGDLNRAAKFKRRLEIAEKFFDRYSKRIDERLVAEWEVLLEAIRLNPQVEKRLREVAAKFEATAYGRGKLSDGDRAALRALTRTRMLQERLVSEQARKRLRDAMRRRTEDERRRAKEAEQSGGSSLGETVKVGGGEYPVIYCVIAAGAPKGKMDISKIYTLPYYGVKDPRAKWGHERWGRSRLHMLMHPNRYERLERWEQRVQVHVGKTYPMFDSAGKGSRACWVFYFAYKEDAQAWASTLNRGGTFIPPEEPPKLIR